MAAVLWCYRCTELLPLRLDIAFALDCLRQELLPAGIALEDFYFIFARAPPDPFQLLAVLTFKMKTYPS